jgi:hypothetical protein
VHGSHTTSRFGATCDSPAPKTQNVQHPSLVSPPCPLLSDPDSLWDCVYGDMLRLRARRWWRMQRVRQVHCTTCCARRSSECQLLSTRTITTRVPFRRLTLLHSYLRDQSSGACCLTALPTYYMTAPACSPCVFLACNCFRVPAHSVLRYFLGSTGWWDDSFHWDDLYDACAVCGKPLGAATIAHESIFSRIYDGCHVTLDCSNATAGCVGSLKFGKEMAA